MSTYVSFYSQMVFIFVFVTSATTQARPTDLPTTVRKKSYTTAVGGEESQKWQMS